jgi:hypothetical protein
VLSVLRPLLCLVAVVPSVTAAAEAGWGDWHNGGGGAWRGGATTSPYYGCYAYGYPYYAYRCSYHPLTATVIRLGCYDYAPNYSGGHGYPYADRLYVRRHIYATVRGFRRVPHRSAATALSSVAATTRTQSLPSKTVQATLAGSASPTNVWTRMTVPFSPSAADEPPKTDVDSTEWAKKFELRLNQLSPDMWAASALLEQEGFRVDSGNKSATGWFLTAHDRNKRRSIIKLQSDGTRIVLAVTGSGSRSDAAPR